MKSEIERKTCDLVEAAKMLGIGRNQAYAAAQAGEIYTISFGKRKVVPLAWLERKLRGEVA